MNICRKLSSPISLQPKIRANIRTMKVAAIIEYTADQVKVKEHFAAHRVYLRQFLENKQLRAAGPLAEDTGAIWILDVESVEAADKIVKGDPFYEADAIVDWKIRKLAYWSAKEARGSAWRRKRCHQCWHAVRSIYYAPDNEKSLRAIFCWLCNPYRTLLGVCLSASPLTAIHQSVLGWYKNQPSLELEYGKCFSHHWNLFLLYSILKSLAIIAPPSSWSGNDTLPRHSWFREYNSKITFRVQA